MLPERFLVTGPRAQLSYPVTNLPGPPLLDAARVRMGARRFGDGIRAHKLVVIEEGNRETAGSLLAENPGKLCQVGRLGAHAHGIGEGDLLKQRQPLHRVVELRYHGFGIASLPELARFL